VVGAAAVPARRPLASPKARRLARERGLRSEDVAGSGPKGAVVAADVARHDAESLPAGGMPIEVGADRSFGVQSVNRCRSSDPGETREQEIEGGAARRRQECEQEEGERPEAEEEQVEVQELISLEIARVVHAGGTWQSRGRPRG
jgi:pyruvate/2-oxoglutarate dehydrogenase complex dihydrolipoamide acyltransferase (E2) component